MCGTPWQSRRYRCCAAPTRVGFALSALVPQENSCYQWAWIMNTPSPSGSGRKVRHKYSNPTLTSDGDSSTDRWGFYCSARFFRRQSGQPHGPHPKDLRGRVSPRLWHSLCVRGDQTCTILDFSWSSFAQQKRCAEFHGGRQDADDAVCSIWSCKSPRTTTPHL